MLTACSKPQPESSQTVAAFEVPLFSASERAKFLTVLDRIAKKQGLHIDAATEDEMAMVGKGIPEAPKLMNATVWRGSADDDAEVAMMDANSHPGRVWVMFSKGEQPELARRFRDQATDEILRLWPNTMPLPIMPTGAIPLREDLIKSAGGYKVDPSAAVKYQLEGRESKRAPEAP